MLPQHFLRQSSAHKNDSVPTISTSRPLTFQCVAGDPCKSNTSSLCITINNTFNFCFTALIFSYALCLQVGLLVNYVILLIQRPSSRNSHWCCTFEEINFNSGAAQISAESRKHDSLDRDELYGIWSFVLRHKKYRSWTFPLHILLKAT